MNWMVFVAGLVGAFTVFGHFTIGSKQYLQPMLDSKFDPIPKKVMHCVFHYISAYLILSTLGLLGVGLGIGNGEGTTLLIKFISLNYLAFGIWQIVLVAMSGIQGGIAKIFQWVLFLIIAVLSWLGA